MAATYFITGTDTGVGKTLIAAGLLHAANGRGLRTAAAKPVAAGCEPGLDGLRNDDALLLQRTASIKLPYAAINPVALREPIAPHIAAADTGIELQAQGLAAAGRRIMDCGADLVVIEGAGGWRVPLNATQTFADIPRLLAIPVIVVVAMRLGCINHALLTAEAIRHDGLAIAGWVANSVQPDMARHRENLATLSARLPYPLLGVVPFCDRAEPETVAQHLNIDPLF